ncbi:Keratin; high-sulfur matrix protein; B2C [Camelus dromedarius]|uniref:Keratin n=1 Tax=Camelus dromedarius TaxID=9838 RepID=A0A5N4D4H2_CAMDR|nr:Keratin; high-sulfur matrix protein; B2C [Camelus dromedarius]
MGCCSTSFSGFPICSTGGNCGSSCCQQPAARPAAPSNLLPANCCQTSSHWLWPGGWQRSSELRTRWCRPDCRVEGTCLPPCCVVAARHQPAASCTCPGLLLPPIYCGQSCCAQPAASLCCQPTCCQKAAPSQLLPANLLPDQQLIGCGQEVAAELSCRTRWCRLTAAHATNCCQLYLPRPPAAAHPTVDSPAAAQPAASAGAHLLQAHC